MERVYEYKLDDEIHRNKIEYYIDSSAEGKIMPEDLCDFFDLCWANPRDRRAMLSKDKFYYDKSGGSKDKIKIVMLGVSELNGFM